MAATEKKVSALTEFLSVVVSRNIGIPPTEIAGDSRLDRLGIDSLQWADIAYEVSLHLGRDVSSDTLASSPTLQTMAGTLLAA